MFKILLILLLLSSVACAETYKVEWVARNIRPGSCPGYNKTSDYKDYGISNLVNISCAVLHLEVVDTIHDREFRTKEEAEEFIEGMPIYNGLSKPGVISYKLISKDKIIKEWLKQ